jgi:isopenicillin N synthase-like dioxygenase
MSVTRERTLPIVDLSEPDVRVLTGRIVDACTDTGFFGVSGHGVPAATVGGAMSAARAFFALPDAHEQRVRRPRPELDRGYIAPGTETLATRRSRWASTARRGSRAPPTPVRRSGAPPRAQAGCRFNTATVRVQASVAAASS